MRPNPSLEVQTSPVERPSVPAWFAEMVILSQYLTTKGLLEAFAHQVRLVRGRFGSYDPLDFLVLLIGYAVSGERTLSDFFQHLAPFDAAFMALFGRGSVSPSLQLKSFPDERRPSLPGSVSHAIRAVQLCPGVDERFHRWYLGSAGVPLPCL